MRFYSRAGPAPTLYTVLCRAMVMFARLAHTLPRAVVLWRLYRRRGPAWLSGSKAMLLRVFALTGLLICFRVAKPCGYDPGNQAKRRCNKAKHYRHQPPISSPPPDRYMAKHTPPSVRAKIAAPTKNPARLVIFPSLGQTTRPVCRTYRSRHPTSNFPLVLPFLTELHRTGSKARNSKIQSSKRRA